MGIQQLSSEVLIPIKDIAELVLHTLPYLVIGATFGWVIGSLRSEFFDRIFNLEKRIFEKMTSDLKLFHTITTAMDHAMMDNRFEFVDMRKEENDNDNDNETSGHYI